MRDDDCVRFLQWALPRLGMRWPGFRRVRRQVCRRIRRRMAELGLRSLEEYRERLGAEPDEWRELDRLCRVTMRSCATGPSRSPEDVRQALTDASKALEERVLFLDESIASRGSSST